MYVPMHKYTNWHLLLVHNMRLYTVYRHSGAVVGRRSVVLEVCGSNSNW